MKAAIVIPALNEAATIGEVVRSALAQIPAVYVVDDGSTDGTVAALDGLAVRVLRHATRRGKGAALETGFAAALADGADAVITMDGDGQHAADDVPRLLAAHARAPRALVLCARTLGRDAQPGLRRFANHFADFWIRWACGQPVSDSQCGQRLYPASLLAALPRLSSDGFAFETEILIEAARRGFPIGTVAIRARYAPGRRASHFRPAADVWRITRLVFVKIVSRGLALPSLVRSFTRPALRLDA